MDKVGKRIKELRLNRKLTQDQVAKAIGITQGALGMIENGVSKSPAAITLVRMARFFEVEPEWLMTGRGAQEPIAALHEDESELVVLYRALSPEGRAYILARSLSIRQEEGERAPQRRRDDPKPDIPKPGH